MEGFPREKWFSPEDAHLAELNKMPALFAEFLQMRVPPELISEQVRSAGWKNNIFLAGKAIVRIDQWRNNGGEQ